MCVLLALASCVCVCAPVETMDTVKACQQILREHSHCLSRVGRQTGQGQGQGQRCGVVVLGSNSNSRRVPGHAHMSVSLRMEGLL